MQEFRAYEAKRMADTVNQFADWAVGISGALTVAANQYGLNRAASILSKAAPFHTGTAASLTFSVGSVARRLGASLLAANIPGTAALGRALGYLGLSNPNIANTAAARNAARWSLSPQAKSTQALLAADRIRTPLSFATKATYFGALALEIGFRAYADSLTGKTREEMVTSGIIGGLKATDNALASVVGGVVGGIVGAGFGSFATLGSGVVPGALIGGVFGATQADRQYRDSVLDRPIDDFFENSRGLVNDHVTPGVVDALDWANRNRDWLGASFGAPGVASGQTGAREPTPGRKSRQIDWGTGRPKS